MVLPPRFQEPPHVVVIDDCVITVRDSDSAEVRLFEDRFVKSFPPVDDDAGRLD